MDINLEEFIKLVKENPDMTIIRTFAPEGVAGIKVTEYYQGNDYIHFKEEDEEDVLADLAGCEFDHAPDGRNIFDLSEEEWNRLYESIEWTKCIVVHITTPKEENNGEQRRMIDVDKLLVVLNGGCNICKRGTVEKDCKSCPTKAVYEEDCIG